jgi:hypothetical protein
MLRRISVIFRKRKDLSEKAYNMLTNWSKLSFLIIVELNSLWNLVPINLVGLRRICQ